MLGALCCEAVSTTLLLHRRHYRPPAVWQKPLTVPHSRRQSQAVSCSTVAVCTGVAAATNKIFWNGGSIWHSLAECQQHLPVSCSMEEASISFLQHTSSLYNLFYHGNRLYQSLVKWQQLYQSIGAQQQPLQSFASWQQPLPVACRMAAASPSVPTRFL